MTPIFNRTILISSLSVLLFLLYGRVGVASIYANGGSVILTKSIFLSNLGSSEQQLKRSERLFFQSVTWEPELYSGWRGLGMSLVKQNSDSAAAEAWKHIPQIVWELLYRGQVAHEFKNYDKALWWYYLAIDISPELGDPWYYLGLTFQSQKHRAEALDAYDHALSASQFLKINTSDIYYRQAIIYQWFPPYQDVNKALDLYNKALSLNRFSSNGLKAQVLYHRGIIYEWQHKPWSIIAEQYQQAVELRPSDYWAHLRLGNALYWEYKDVSLAETEFGKALNLWPDNDERFFFYQLSGNVYFDAGVAHQACQSYKHALEIQPQNDGILEKIQHLSFKCLSK